MLKKTYIGPLSKSFVLMGRLCFSMDLSNGVDTRETNEFMQLLEGHRIQVTIEEVGINVR